MFWDKMVKNVQGCEQKIVEVFNKANEFLYDKYNQI